MMPRNSDATPSHLRLFPTWSTALSECRVIHPEPRICEIVWPVDGIQSISRRLLPINAHLTVGMGAADLV